MDNKTLGNVIREMRTSQKMTLQELSKKSRLSTSYLSMLERNINNPTISSLQSICFALNINISKLTPLIPQSALHVKKEQRRELFNDHNEVIYYSLTDNSRSLRAFIMKVFDRSYHASEKHVNDEISFIIQGSMVVVVENTPYELNEGDLLYIPSGSNHGFYRTSDDFCISIHFYQGPG